MISATGNSLARQKAGFTLIEIVFALGLIALASGIVVINAIRMLDRSKETSTNEILFQAIQEARFIAAADRKNTELRFNKETGSLEIRNSSREMQSLALGEDFADQGQSAINFYLVPPSRGLDPVEDPLRTRLEAKAIRFAPDRSSSPFVVEIDTGSGTPARIAVDPFSSLERQVRQ
ncbi:MAG: type II secretion system protein [Verrucomicrobiota bacterium]